jgi:deferrochelatase/peroxidase EfeB
MITEPSDQDLDDEVQGLALTGYSADCMRTLVLTVNSAVHAREFVAELLGAGLLDFGGKRHGTDPLSKINIGISYEGLRALGAPERILANLRDKSPAFGAGASQRAARYLGDSGDSAVERWTPAFKRSTAHIWISIHGADQAEIADATTALRSLPGAIEGLAGWERKAVPDGQHLGAAQKGIRMVHFGLRDNITKPSILDENREIRQTGPDGKPFRPRPGELLLGYPNNDDADLWTPDATPEDIAAFLRNGSFGVLRHLQQHEDILDDYLEREVAILVGQGRTFVTKTYLKAKMCGRWPNGAALLPHVTAEPPDPGLHLVDEFDFTKDANGWGCPFGAHVRRTNPRTDPLMPRRNRTLFRRGVPYGARYQPGSTTVEPEDARGLIGVFFCARIEDQFEHLVSEWMEKKPMGPPNPGRAKDPIAGRHDEPGAQFHIPLIGEEPIVLGDLVPFIRTRGTMYALFPSRQALKVIAAGEYWGRS